MSLKTFFVRLFLVILVSSAGLGVLHILVIPAQTHWPFSILSVTLFSLICLGLFYAGKHAAQSKNKFAFTNLISISVLGKMVLAMAGLFAYQYVAQPQNQWFVGIFLWCYLLFTIFEVWFMTKLAKG